MRWHDLLAGLDDARYLPDRAGDADVEVAAITHDSRDVTPGSCFACIPGAVTDGHDHAPEAVARGAVALLVERPLPLDVAAGRGAERARRARAGRRHPLREPLGRDAGARRHRHQRQDHHHLPARGDRARARGDRVGVVGTVGARVAGRDDLQLEHRRAHHARGERPAGAAARDARRGARHRRDGGVVARARTSTASTACSSPRCASPTSATSTSTTTVRSTTTSRPRRRCSHASRTPAAAVNVDDPRGRRARAACGRRRHRRLDLRRRRRRPPTSARPQ